MTTQTEALKLALEALIGVRAFLESDAPVEIWGVNDKAITAIKEALSTKCVAQPEHDPYDEVFIAYGLPQIEQEPVAWVVYSSAENDIVWADKGKRLKQNTPLYTTPPQRKPLTREVIDRDFYGRVDFVRQIESAHGIKE